MFQVLNKSSLVHVFNTTQVSRRLTLDQCGVCNSGVFKAVAFCMNRLTAD